MKQYRINGLSFEEELRGETLSFGKRITYLGLNGVLQRCNWLCKYCLEGSPKDRGLNTKESLSLEEQIRLIDEASDLGVRGLLITGGEPFTPKRKDETVALVKRAYEKDLVPLVYTNGSFICDDLVKALADYGASISLKIDSLVSEKYDIIAQKIGAYNSTMRAIDMVRKTSIGKPLFENGSGILVRLLFATVGNALNVDEYASIARFATNHSARWMMEYLNLRGDATNFSELAINWEKHSESMKYALMLNPEQGHDIDKQGYCRLFYMVTVNTSTGDYGVCPQDYAYLGNIRETSLKEASKKVLRRDYNPDLLKVWNGGKCPIKENHFTKKDEGGNKYGIRNCKGNHNKVSYRQRI